MTLIIGDVINRDPLSIGGGAYLVDRQNEKVQTDG